MVIFAWTLSGRLRTPNIGLCAKPAGWCDAFSFGVLNLFCVPRPYHRGGEGTPRYRGRKGRLSACCSAAAGLRTTRTISRRFKSTAGFTLMVL